MKIQVLMLKQDDPRKCTAVKLVKFGLAKVVKRTSTKTLVLDPFAKNFLLPKDNMIPNSLTAIDCSWNFAENTFRTNFSGIPRKLPPLFAGNPVNYSKINKLTTAEAIAAALHIFGFTKTAFSILNKFKWGHTFFELNQNLLEDYSKLKSEKEIESILLEYNINA